ncbi:response regulator transcription factor [Nocardioides pantholopis]|uniref:response regulator transcription factor n=1 Tax=Nocardioides pantholopis TaxID=2483798 RepID=UPI001F152145|nr:response regulator transcription factor [Nocardioides pantholopis]
MPVRVALTNDYEIVTQGLRAMLEEHADRVRVVEATVGSAIAAEADVILFDTFGRLVAGDEKLRRVVRENDAKVVVFSWESYPESLALECGAVGIIHKGLTGAELAAALVAIHEGRPFSLPHPASETMPAWPGREHGLSPREAELLSLIVQGLTNQEMAERTYLSINTVKTYVRSCYRKIGVVSRSQAVVWGLRNGFDVDEQQPTPRRG